MSLIGRHTFRDESRRAHCLLLCENVGLAIVHIILRYLFSGQTPDPA
jgi:hypothetical protein